MREFINQGEQQCIEELKKSLEEQAAGQEIDKEVLETEINRVKEEWAATFEELISKGLPQTQEWQQTPGASSGGPAPVSWAASAHGDNLCHRCSVAITAEQAAQVHVVRKRHECASEEQFAGLD